MITEITVGKSQVCREILDDLPEWFGLEDAKTKYVADVATMLMLVAHEHGQTIGFVALKEHNKFASEIYVMGVKRAWHGKGTGGRLVDAATALSAEKDLRYLTVKTVAATSADANYARTRQFYERSGFVPLEIFPTLWLPSNPCLFMVRAIAVA